MKPKLLHKCHRVEQFLLDQNVKKKENLELKENFVLNIQCLQPTSPRCRKMQWFQTCVTHCISQPDLGEPSRYSEPYSRWWDQQNHAAACMYLCGCVQYEFCGCSLFSCVSTCSGVHSMTMTEEGVVSSFVPKPFPADAGELAQSTSDFLSSGCVIGPPGQDGYTPSTGSLPWEQEYGNLAFFFCHLSVSFAPRTQA